jgi:MFS family permease
LFFCQLAVGAGNLMLTSAVLPPLTRSLGLPDWTAGAIFSLSAAVWVVTAPYWGARSNVMGRRPVTAIGMFGFAASMALFALFSIGALMGWIKGWMLIFALLLFARTLFGVFGAATTPASQAYVADRTTREERTEQIATLTAGFTLGQMAGPAIAAVLMTLGGMMSATYGILAPVVVITIVAVAIGVIVLVALPENRKPMADAAPAPSGAKGLWRSPQMFSYLLYAVGISLVIGVLSQTFPYAIMDRMHVTGAASAQYTGPAMTMGAMATLIAQLVIIPRMKLSIRSLMIYGALILGISSLFMVSAGNFAVFAFAQILYGFGQGMARPGFSAGVSLAATPEQQGDAAGYVTAANGMGFIVSPIFGLWMYDEVSPASPFIFCGVVTVALGVYALMATPKPSRPKREAQAEVEAVSQQTPPD